MVLWDRLTARWPRYKIAAMRGVLEDDVEISLEEITAHSASVAQGIEAVLGYW